MTNTVNEIGLAIIGCGTIGRIRAEFARDYPGVTWLGLCDVKEELGKQLAIDAKADFFTKDFEELINRPEVNAVMIITEENKHTDPTLLAVEQGHKLFIENIVPSSNVNIPNVESFVPHSDSALSTDLA